MIRIALIALLLATSLTASDVHAAEGFVPIAPIPVDGGELNESTTLEDYINAVFQLALTVGAVLAVIMIAWGGFEYMLSQTLPGQKDGRARIQQALFGLAILLVVYLVLYIINPDIVVSLNIFDV